ncbi:RNA-dependent RNA polymerase [Rhizoctonia solani partitivirus 433]|nr:RNA-dependent RNA polymerase [Rhizoctonia solani partitivirus 433]WDD45107.1 RNA-dependent RNA polymerase [Rhizoctonia solani virus JC1]
MAKAIEDFILRSYRLKVCPNQLRPTVTLFTIDRISHMVLILDLSNRVFYSLHVTTYVTLRLLLRFQIKKRQNRTHTQLRYPIRNIYFEWTLRRSSPKDQPPTIFVYEKSILSYIDLATSKKIEDQLENSTLSILEHYSARNEDFSIYEEISQTDVPEDRLPASGIKLSLRRYHSIPSSTLHDEQRPQIIINDPYFVETPDFRSNIVYSEETDLSGSPPVPEILSIIQEWFPSYLKHLDELCRPPSYGPQAFQDFNRPTPNPAPPPKERHDTIIRIILLKMAIKPYRPIHFADTLAGDQPLITSASYFSKFDPHSRIYARYSAPSLYRDRPTSKGYFLNVVLNQFRRELHNVKDSISPYSGIIDEFEIPHANELWFAKHPAQLFIRTQISKRAPDQPKKIRPVYSVDDRFLTIEKMLTLPALAQLRNPQSCVAHGLETFRGSMQQLNLVFYYYASFISIDWSQFDQRLPSYVILSFFLDYLPQLLIISHGYMPTRQYPDSTQPKHIFANKIFNILIFMLQFYLNMTFLSYDGFAYIREHGGVPSGALNTQHLDSFGNMYVICDCLLEFGFTEQECLQMLFCVMGDDNLIFMQDNIAKVTAFMTFLEHYCETKHGMVLSILKSAFSHLRNKLTFLSYDNDDGHPTRSISKLVAQLALPERPINPERKWIHSARALGLAFASCGQDQTFHLLCKMVYEKFKPSGPVPSEHIMKTFKKWKFQLPEFDIQTPEYEFPTFPTCAEIRHRLNFYEGFLSEADKWNDFVFTVPPSDNLTDYVTLKEYIDTDANMQLIISKFWQGFRTL